MRQPKVKKKGKGRPAHRPPPVYRKPGETLTQFARRYYKREGVRRMLLEANEDARYKS